MGGEVVRLSLVTLNQTKKVVAKPLIAHLLTLGTTNALVASTPTLAARVATTTERSHLVASDTATETADHLRTTPMTQEMTSDTVIGTKIHTAKTSADSRQQDMPLRQPMNKNE
jgi:hypothetical protein